MWSKQYAVFLLVSFAVVSPLSSVQCGPVSTRLLKKTLAVDISASFDAQDPAVLIKWVPASAESRLKNAFRVASAISGAGSDARTICEGYILAVILDVLDESAAAEEETAKDTSRAVYAAEEAVFSGSADGLMQSMMYALSDNILKRYGRVAAARNAGDKNFATGYIEFLEYVEKLAGTIGTFPAPRKKTE